MFKLIKMLIQLAVFATIVLVIGNLIHWQGRTLSDQVKVGLASALRTPVGKNIQKITKDVLDETKKGGFQPSSESSNSETIRHSERQKLRALIQETQ